MATSQNANRDFADYLRRRLQYLECCNGEIEDKLSENEMTLCRKIDDGEYSKNDPRIAKIIFHLECIVRNTFRYTMLVGVCSFLEEAIKGITKRLVADYDARLKAQKDGNWLHRHLQVLSDCVGLDIVPFESEVSVFDDLITLRNCIVHAWGKLAESHDPRAVQAASERTESAEVSKDGYLVLGDQVIPGAIIAAEKIADGMLASKLRVSMK